MKNVGKINIASQLVPISLIWVNREGRQRKELEVKDLERSLERIGLIHPIVITKEFELKTGERRWTAAKNLGWTEILARFAEDLSPTEARILELEENAKRQDLPWRDTATAIVEIHQLYLELDPLWTQAQTAESLSSGEGHVSLYLKVGAHLNDPRVGQASSAREAYNILSRREVRAAGEELNEMIEFAREMWPERHGGLPAPAIPQEVVAAALQAASAAEPLPAGELSTTPLGTTPLVSSQRTPLPVYQPIDPTSNAGVAESLGTPLVTETTQVEPLSPAPQVKGEH